MSMSDKENLSSLSFLNDVKNVKTQFGLKKLNERLLTTTQTKGNLVFYPTLTY